MSTEFRKQTFHAAEEAFGLGEIAQTQTLRTPRVVSFSSSEIVLEQIDGTAPTREFWTKFGAQLAQMHKIEQKCFGFVIDNHIGATPQANPRSEKTWADYFIDHRLKPMAARLKGVEIDFQPIYRELIAVTEPPSLVHGDLWNGNFLCASGEPVVIDPAPYWGHREVDLAMSELFGGFAPEFYESYSREFPVMAGYERRREIYNLYHLLNHWVLFGGAYRGQALALIEIVTGY